MRIAWVLSVLVHALLVSLSFGSQGLGLPGLEFPWRERRFEAEELRVVLEPAPAPALASATAPAWVEPSADREPTPVAKAEPKAANDAPSGNAAMAVVAPVTGRVPESVAAPPPPSPPPTPAPAVMAVEKSIVPTLAVPVAPLEATPVIATASRATRPEVAASAPRDADDALQKQIDQDAKEAGEAKERAVAQAKLERVKQEEQRQAELTEAARQLAARQETERKEAARQATVRQEAEQTEAARLEAERLEAARQAVARKEAARVEAERQEAAQKASARLEAERAEAARVEAERQEAARQAAARKDAARVAAERAEAARQAAVRQEAERMEAARLEGSRQEAARQEAVAQEKARQVAARAEEDAKRDAVRRAMGRQLDEEAAKRDAAARAAAGPSSTLPYSWSSARRGRLFGRTDSNTELLLYGEAWSRKIELNMTFDMVREAAKERHNHPLVTVALRSDGSVESVTFVVSSGVPAIDEAIRRVVQSQAPYPAFSPALARQYDVIEIRRSWHFDMAVRLY